MLYYLKNPATKGIIENQASRPDISSKFNLTTEEETFLNEQWHRNQHSLVTKMVHSQSYKSLLEDKAKFKRNIVSILDHNLVGGLLGINCMRYWWNNFIFSWYELKTI